MQNHTYFVSCQEEGTEKEEGTEENKQTLSMYNYKSIVDIEMQII